jgi:NAD(P)-dependent dehydrogenase (short-subunit alcohol dehydrogenase family)
MSPILILFFSLFVLWLGRRFFNGPRAKSTKNMKDKVVVITGCSAGIGKETARDLLLKNATVIFANRDQNKTKIVMDEIFRNHPEIDKSKAEFLPLNLNSLKSVKNFADSLKTKHTKIDILINNAGCINLNFGRTEDGLESTFHINHISPTVLTALLLDSFKTDKDARIINVSSEGHKFPKQHENFFASSKSDYSSFNTYAITKLANVLFTFKLKAFCNKKNLNIKSASLHPGAVFTEIARVDDQSWYIKLLVKTIGSAIMKYFFKTEEMGAQTTLELCYMDREKFVDGGYYSDCRLTKLSPKAYNQFFIEKINGETYDNISNSSIYEECVRNEMFEEFISSFSLNK